MTGANAKIKKIYVGTNLVRPKPQDITETYNIGTGGSANYYKSGYKAQTVVIDLDYNNPSSGWTGCTVKIGVQDTSKSIGWYIWGGYNSSSYPNSDGKIEGNAGSGITKIYDSTHKYISKGTTVHLKATFTREGISLKVGNNAEETYLYSSGSWGATAISFMDDTKAQVWCRQSSGGASVSNVVATVTYTPA